MKYTETHEWIRVEGKIGTVGITQYAQQELGEIVYIELPKVGSKIRAGEEVCVLESTKAAADVYSPVSGKIIAIHEELRTSTQKINQLPETEGWLYRIELDTLEELKKLLSKTDYDHLLRPY